jgi:hypothetical protein
LLNRLGFSFKKTTLVSAKADADKQQAFVHKLDTLMEQLPADEIVYFADAVHPQHNTRPAYGWIERGEQRQIDCNCSRFRLNINAVVNARNPCEVIAHQAPTINSASTIGLLEAVWQANPAKKQIHLICDSARYYVSSQVQAWLKGKPIVLHHLPAYCPNLNVIERLWKFMRKQVIDSTHYATLGAFRGGVMGFLSDLEPYRTQLESLMVLKFEIVRFRAHYSQSNYC